MVYFWFYDYSDIRGVICTAMGRSLKSNYFDFGEIVQFIFTTGKNVSKLIFGRLDLTLSLLMSYIYIYIYISRTAQLTSKLCI